MKFNDKKNYEPKETEEIVIDGAVMHKVSEGDTLESIAKEHKVTVQSIKDMNRRDLLTNMKSGQLIRVK